MINVLYLHSGAELYGADQILINIVTNIDRSKFTPYVVLPNKGPLVDILREKGIPVEVIYYPIIRRKYFNLHGVIRYLYEYRNSVKSLEKFIKNKNINIIHNNTLAVFEGISLSKNKNIPLIFHIHEMIEHPKFIVKIMYWIAVKKATRVIVVSDAVKKHINRMIGENEKITTIYNGIVPCMVVQNEKERDLRREFGISDDAVVIGIVGRINAIKGQKEFVTALSTLITKKSEVFGIIVGDAFAGQEWRIDDLKQYIKQNNMDKHIALTGFIKNMQAVYKCIDILVLSSIQNDSFPTVVLEAMANSIPVVAYDCGGVTEMIDDGENGFIVPQHDTKGLSCKIYCLASDEKRRKKFGIYARKKFNECFAVTKFLDKIEYEYTLVAKI